MKKTLYYDITNLYEWKGNLTGIPRTTDEIALRLRDTENVQFITWNFADKRFELIDIEDYYENIAPKNRAFFKKHPKDVGKDQRYSFAGIIKKVIRHSYVLSKTTELTLKSIRRAKDITKNAVETEPLVLDKGATVFIPCGLWDNERYIQTLVQYKEEGAYLAFLSYDLLPIVVPQFSGQWGKPMKDFTDRITSLCDIVFSISEHTKGDLEKHLRQEKLRVPKITTIRLGDMFSSTKPATPTDKRFLASGILQTKEDFILCTGTLEARKNHTLLYYTYKLAASRGVKLPRLVVAGRPGYRTRDIISIIEDDLEVNRSIILLKDVSDEELSWLYAHCKFSVYPSFYEGWGLPIAESISKGVPCLASNTSSMTEVAPGFVDYFNPASPEECLAAIDSYMDKKRFTEVKQRTKNYKPVSWDTTFRQVAAELDKLR